MDFYDLQHESVQKRYTTVAMQYYRDRLRAKIDGAPFNREKPDYEKGRQQASLQTTPQKILYHGLSCKSSNFISFNLERDIL